MYGLRLMNNGYADYAGSRGDFVVVGHPEYNRGKITSDNEGYGVKWDTTPIPHFPRKSVASDRLKKRGVARFIKEISTVQPKASYKERALARTKSDPLVGYRKTDGGGEFCRFMAELENPETTPSMGPPIITSGYGNHVRTQPLHKHYKHLHDDIEDLKARLKLAPEATKRELLDGDLWKYYAQHMGAARRQEDSRCRTKARSVTKVTSTMKPLSGPSPIPLG
eukprot:TRINITY_DN82842_c0_g1_i1.p1 TRINITY_DN82842_c0_g1~~TRINITY_DN82842_c0_g1_i1.p1  ORF type:complete len:223 (+),score=37.41 TRINITY_DN82842_c0_g1_i1:111-779(+)